MGERIQATVPTYPWLVLEEAGETLGYAYANRFASRAAYRWSVETSVYVAPGAHGRGIGRALYESLLAVAHLQGYVQALAGIALPNPGSVALHERVGFVPVAVYHRVGWKLGAWHDVGWWQRQLRESADETEEPEEPIPVDRLPATTIARILAKGVDYVA
jgi:phosphinothricin acetyltransferase